MADDPTEHVQEHLQHTAAHGDHGGHASKWITAAALTAAFLAAFAAVTGALATKHLTESTLTRIEANDNWNFYQSKSIKNSILDQKIYSAQLAKAEPRKKDIDKMGEYAVELPAIQHKADGLEKLSKMHLETHETFEFAATMFHISIAIVAISVVAKRKEFWYLSMALGVGGLYFFSTALAHQPKHAEHEEEHAATQSGPAHPGAAGGEHGAGGHGTTAPGGHEGSHEGPAASHPGEAPAGEHVPAGEPMEHSGH